VRHSHSIFLIPVVEYCIMGEGRKQERVEKQNKHKDKDKVCFTGYTWEFARTRTRTIAAAAQPTSGKKNARFPVLRANINTIHSPCEIDFVDSLPLSHLLIHVLAGKRHSACAFFFVRHCRQTTRHTWDSFLLRFLQVPIYRRA
jgi:hypothetical protein